MIRPGALLTLTLLAAPAFLHCGPAVRSDIDPGPVSEQEAGVDGMNRHLLTNLVSDRLIVEIDWVTGHRPHDKAISALEETLRRYLPRDKTVRVDLDDEIPVDRHERATGQHGGLEQLAADYLDRDPRNWREEEVVYVLYLPRSEPWHAAGLFGLTDWLTLPGADGPFSVQTVYIFADRVRREALLWVSAAKIDRSILVHEFGHVLGLVANPRHIQAGRPAHCSDAQCVMHRPTAWSTAANALPALFAGHIPHDYCHRCRADLEAAAAGDPSGVERLVDRRTGLELTLAAHWHERAGNWSEAIDAASRAIEVGDRDDIDLLGALARMQAMADRPEEALATLQRAAALNPAIHRVRRAELLCLAGRYDEALDEIDAAAVRAGDDFFSRRVLASALTGTGRHEEAGRLWAEYASRSGLHPLARNRATVEAGRCYLRAGRVRQAEMLLREALDRLPREAGLRLALGRLLRDDGRVEEGSDQLQAIVAGCEPPNSPDAGPDAGCRSALALALALLGDERRARRALDLLAATEESGAAAITRGRVLARFDDRREALAALESVPRILVYREADPCFDEDLDSLRTTAGFRRRFPGCAAVTARARASAP